MNNDVGSIEYSARINTSQLAKDGAKADNIVQDVGGNMQKAGDKSANSFGKLGVQIGAVSGVVSSVMDTAITSVTNSIDGAIKRVDTLNNASRTFANMGFAVQDVDAVMKDLDASIKGLPTPIDAAVRGVQMLAGSTNDLDKSQEIFAALNNAILGFGGTANDVEGAILQISQAFAGGRVDAATWNSMLENNLGPTLNAIAKDMGLTSASLKKGLSEGTISVEDFQDALIKMNKEGGGGLASLEKISKDATSGIGTGMANAQTAVTRGVAKIIEAIGSTNISNAVSSIGKAFEFLLVGISNVIKGSAELFNFLKDNSGLLSQIAIVLVTVLTPAIIKFGIESTIAFGKYIAGVTLALRRTLIASARMAAAWLLALGPIGLIVTAVVAAAALIVMNWDKVSEVMSDFSDMAVKVFDDISKSAGEVLSSIGSFFSNLFAPVVAVFTSIISWINENWQEVAAIIFFPFSLALGVIIKNWSTITTFFQGILDKLVSIFAPIFTAIYNTVSSIITPIVTLFTNVFNRSSEATTAAFSGVGKWFGDRSKEIQNAFAAVPGFFKGVFQGAWNGIVTVFSPIVGFFRGIWDKIVALFGNVGTRVGDVIGNAFKSVINTVLNGAVGIINGFIDAINGAVDVINEIPGVNIGRVSRLGVPQLAQGGIVTSPTLAMIGEGKESEAVIPLSKLDTMLNGDGRQNGPALNLTVNMSGIMTSSPSDERAVARRLIERFNEELRAKGMPEVGKV